MSISGFERPPRLGRVVVWEGEHGIICEMGEEFHATFDDLRMIVRVRWDDRQETSHLLTEFSFYGGRIDVK